MNIPAIGMLDQGQQGESPAVQLTCFEEGLQVQQGSCGLLRSLVGGERGSVRGWMSVSTREKAVWTCRALGERVGEEQFQSGKSEGPLARDTQARDTQARDAQAAGYPLDSAVLSRKQAASLARWGRTSGLGKWRR